MNYLSGAGLIVAISSILNSFLVLLYSKNKNTKFLNFTWTLFNLTVGLWGLGLYCLFSSSNMGSALYWGRFLNCSAIFIPIFFFNFVCILLKIYNDKKKEICIYYGIATVMFIAVLLFPNLFIPYVEIAFTNFYYPKPNIIYYVYTFQFAYLISYSMGLLFKAKNNTKYSLLEKNQLKYLILGCSVGFLGGSMAFFPVFGINIPPIGIYLTPFYIFTVSYAIINHNLMDIDLAWRKLAKNVFYYCIFAVYVALLSFILFNFKLNYYGYAAIVFVSFFLLYSVSEKLKVLLYNLFLGKYHKVWEKLKAAAKIKSDEYEQPIIVNILALDIPKAINLTYAAYYELKNPSKKYEILTTTDKKYYASTGSATDSVSKDILFESKLVEELYERKSFLYLEHLAKDEKNKELVEILKDLKVDLSYPIFDNEVLVGILVYGKKQNNAVFHGEDLEILRDIIKDAEYQINNIYKINHISEKILTKYKTTYQVQLLEESKRLGDIRDLTKFCEHSRKLVNRLLNASETNFWIYNEDKKIYIKHVLNEDGVLVPSEILPETNYLITYLNDIKDMVLTIDLEKLAKNSHLKDLEEAADTARNMNATIIIPLIDVSHLLGFLTVSNRPNKEQKYSHDDFLLLSFICDKIQSTLAHIYTNQKAYIDNLTGMYARISLDYSLESEITKSVKEGTPLCCAFIDANGFSFFNDMCGYFEGDMILKVMATRLMRVLRPTDRCYRWGGDEFVVIFGGTDIEGSKRAAERISEEFGNDRKIKKAEKIFARDLTFSIGVSIYNPKKGDTQYTIPEIEALSEMLLARAIKAMKKAKKKAKKLDPERSVVCVDKEFDRLDYRRHSSLVKLLNDELDVDNIDDAELDAAIEEENQGYGGPIPVEKTKDDKDK